MEIRFNDQEEHRRAKLEKYKEIGIAPFGKRFNRTHYAAKIKKEFAQYTHDELEAKPHNVCVAGRIMTLRDLGKVAFFTLQDITGKIQVYLRRDGMDIPTFDKVFKLADVGDIVGIKGTVMLTKTGEITIRCTEFVHLSKALKPLPEKFHGLTDVEERYRKRYLDLIMNEESKNVALLRPKIIRSIQKFMDSRGFIEVETPVLQPILGGAAARPFVTHHNTLDADFYLRIATELSLKKLIVGGLEKVYEIGRIFRNEGMDTRHNPEFTTIEAYEAYSDLYGMMELCENLFKSVCLDTLGTTIVHRKDVEIDFSKPFRKVRMAELVKEKTGVDFDKIRDFEEAKKLAEERGLKVEKHFTGVGHILNLFFEEYCESSLIQPTFLTEHPIEITPLAKKSNSDPRYAQRFELYICGVEYANAYTELNDPDDQKERFENQLKERDLGNEEANQIDYEFLDALQYGMPPTGGIGIGVDRLTILLSEVDSIRDVLLFPHMRIK